MSDKSQSLDRGLAILELIDAHGSALGVREIARRLALSPTVVQRLIVSLMNAEFLSQDRETQKYSLGYRALSLGHSMLTEDKLVSVAVPVLTSLANRMHVNSFLAVESRSQLVYVLALQSSGPIALRSTPGASAPFHSTAMGKALLAEEDSAHIDKLIGTKSLDKITDKTITSRKAFDAELAAIRTRGYAMSMEENLPGVVAAGAVIRNAAGIAIASISAAYAPVLQPEILLPNVIRETVLAAAEISQALGCPRHFLKSDVSPLVVSNHAG